MKKILTIKEPYVTPFYLDMKHYETRSWKTNYRGEIYLHTSKTLAKNPTFPLVLFPTGHIVLRGNLTDCIEMTEEFIEEIKKDSLEYATGFYDVGRYAWKIEDIEPVYPIKVNGHLGIWNYDGEIKIRRRYV